MSDQTLSPEPTTHERDHAPGRTLAYGGMGQGAPFTGAKPGETAIPSVIQVNVNPVQAKPDVGSVLAAPLRQTKIGKTWWESTHGRVGTRLISRGVFGAFFYAVASMVVERAMQRYTPHADINDPVRYKDANHISHRFIRGSAMLLDKTFGRALKGAGDLVGIGDHLTVFRNTRYFGRTDAATGREVMGRSLGHEYVDVVFNFAAASVGDSTARNIASLLDPNKPISWLEDGKFDFKKFAVSQGRRCGRPSATSRARISPSACPTSSA